MDRDFLAAQARAEAALSRRRELTGEVEVALAELRARRDRHPETLIGVDLDRRALPAEPREIERLGRAALEELAASEKSIGSRLEARLGVLQRIAGILDAIEAGRSPLLRLGPAPRKVPFSYVAAEAATWWAFLVFGLAAFGILAAPSRFVLACAGPAVVAILCFLVQVRVFDYRFAPLILPTWVGGAAFAGVFSLLGVDGRILCSLLPLLYLFLTSSRALGRKRFLARCVDADQVEVVSSQFWSQELRLPDLSGRGWNAHRFGACGVLEKTRLKWQAGEASGHHRYFGPPWNGGVLLVDPNTGKARTLPDLGSAPRPDVAGEWKPHLRPQVRLRTTLVIFAAIIWFVAVLAAFGYKTTACE